ncbi:MAG: radical SAM family heme chaperone HemW [Clostridia bacterium]|nr:radical SAM family heme chaperone HemW [Clostridia bacterium]
MIMKENKIGLYIHIPFCKSKCLYCDFNSACSKDHLIPGYFDALKHEILLYRESLAGADFATVFIGGGTPSYVDSKYIYETVHWVKQNFNLAEAAEVTMEANPGTLTVGKLETYAVSGINRISMGLQAWQEPLLKSLGRIHTSEDFVENYKQARKAGFKNINIDLIFGLPGQQLSDWEETLYRVMELNPEHISCYSLKIEEGTGFGQKLEEGKIEVIDDVLDREMYYLAQKKFGENGYKQYEISNFAKEGYVSEHNLIYWKGMEYIGLGAGAHSYYEGERFNNKPDIEEYIGFIERNVIPRENEEVIGQDEKMTEFMILGLRLIDGISIRQFNASFGEDIFHVFGEALGKLQKKELIKIEADRIKLSSLGLDMANQVFLEFI